MTKTQEQVLMYLRAQGFGGRDFRADEAFPANTPEDRAHRHALGNLAREGHLTHPGRQQDIYQFPQQALEGWVYGKSIDLYALYEVSMARQVAEDALQAKVITLEVHQYYTTQSLEVLQDSRSGVQLYRLVELQLRSQDDGRQRERETSLNHEAEHQRGQDMGL